MRRELEKKDEEIKRVSGKGGAPGADDWSYLNSFSRVPVSTFYLFSLKSKLAKALDDVLAVLLWEGIFAHFVFEPWEMWMPTSEQLNITSFYSGALTQKLFNWIKFK